MPVRVIDKDTGDARYLRRRELGQPNGVAALDATGHIAPGLIPPGATGDHGALAGLGDDDHPQYLTAGRGATVAAAAVATHEAATDPHPQYLTAATAAPVQSVNGAIGDVVLDAADVGAEPAGAVAAHVALFHPEHIDGGAFVGAAFDLNADGGGF